MEPEKHIPPDVLMRIGGQYVAFVDTLDALMKSKDDIDAYTAHQMASNNLLKTYVNRFKGCDRPKRFYAVEAGATYTIVAFDANHAWLLFGCEVAITELGEELLGQDVAIAQIPPDMVATKTVRDDDGPGGRTSYPLAEADVGAVFCSEY